MHQALFNAQNHDSCGKQGKLAFKSGMGVSTLALELRNTNVNKPHKLRKLQHMLLKLACNVCACMHSHTLPEVLRGLGFIFNLLNDMHFVGEGTLDVFVVIGLLCCAPSPR